MLCLNKLRFFFSFKINVVLREKVLVGNIDPKKARISIYQPRQF